MIIYYDNVIAMYDIVIMRLCYDDDYNWLKITLKIDYIWNIPTITL